MVIAILVQVELVGLHQLKTTRWTDTQGNTWLEYSICCEGRVLRSRNKADLLQ